MVDNWTQTIGDDTKSYQRHPPGVIGSGYHDGVNYNQYSLIDQIASLGFSNHVTPPINNNDGRPPYIQQMQTTFDQSQMWANNYNYQPSRNEDLGLSGFLGMLQGTGPTLSSVNHDISPMNSSALQDTIPLEENGVNSSDILDEREDLAIERSLIAEEKQQSYAAALKEKQMATGKCTS